MAAVSREAFLEATAPATLDDCRRAVEVVHGAMGLGPAVTTTDPELMTAADKRAVAEFAGRVDELAEVLACGDWTRAEVLTAARVLASSPDLDDKLRYGRPITAADFERLRRGAERTERGDGGEERQLVTLTGFALRIRRARLYSYAEAMGLWNSTGAQAGPYPTPTHLVEPVRVEGEEKPRWRVRP